MNSFNSCTLVGRTGAVPQLRRTQAGTPVTSFNVAVDRNDGPGATVTDWFEVECWGKQAEWAALSLPKGQLVLVHGSMVTRQWKDDRGQHTGVKLKAQTVTLLMPKTTTALPEQSLEQVRAAKLSAEGFF